MKCFMFNKPSGCITARKDTVHKTVMDYFPEELRDRFHPLGRLDKDTEGLLIFSDDGHLDMQIMQPENHVPKTYHFRAIGCIDDEKVYNLENGVMLKAQTVLTKPAKFRFVSQGVMRDIVGLIPERYREKMEKNPDIPVFEAYLTITEGRKHQVKRMLKAVGCCVVWLRRVSVGALQLDENLEPGCYREMNDDEIQLLFNK